MKAIVLAAGYGTRLQAVVKDIPKSLIKIGDRTILDYLIEQLDAVGVIDEIIIITNSRFFSVLSIWKDSYRGSKRLQLLSDGTSRLEDRLGAVGDLQYTVKAAGINDDILVCAADNIIKFRLADFVTAFCQKKHSMVVARQVEDIEDRKKRGVAVLGDDNRVLEFEEKPEHPKSIWTAAPFYIYLGSTIPKINEYLDAGKNPDAPGHFVEWLCTKEPVYAYTVDEQIVDVGNPDSLARAQTLFKQA